MLEEDAAIINEFLIESHENLDQLDSDLVLLESDPSSREVLARVFRTIHTIKGTSGFLAFHRLESLTHAGENLLAKLRDGALVMTPETASALLEMVDAVREILRTIESQQNEGNPDVTALVASLTTLSEGETTSARGSNLRKPEIEPEISAETVVDAETSEEDSTIAEESIPEEESLRADTSVPTEPVRNTPPARVGAKTTTAGTDKTASALGEATIRVDVNLLEQLVRLVGELVLSRNQIVARASTFGDDQLTRSCHRLNLVTGELQEGIMRTRMQPIDHIWSKLPRVVRDLSSQLGRKVRLEMYGAETELDRTLLEAVKDPLTHLVRNAIDHGIESPHIRRDAGKDETGVLSLRAAHEGGQILVEITDDGKGLDPAVLGAKALEKGLVTQDRLEAMTANDIMQLVFLPGFSTASAVTNVSGRGVGMDVVRTNIERIGGSIDVESRVGKGTAWQLRIPLTLAIVPALTVECAGQRFAIPQANLLELVSLDEGSNAFIESVAGAEVYRLRGSLLPLVRLEDAIGMRRQEIDEAQEQRQSHKLVLAVLEADGRRFGLVVDRVLDTEEIVVKPLSRTLKELGLYAGATILGDGAVSLILDIQSLARRRMRAVETHDSTSAGRAQASAASDSEHQLLVVSVGADRRVAVPLDVVTRLEQFPVESIERVGRRYVVRYRGSIMPLVYLCEHLGTEDDTTRSTIAGVVYTSHGRSVALAVGRIVDIVSDSSVVLSDVEDFRLIGSAVIRDRVTEMLDVRAAILAADPLFFDNDSEASAAFAASVSGYDPESLAPLGTDYVPNTALMGQS